MAQALFITITDLKKYSILGGNIDSNKLIPSLKTAQELEIETVLGTDLYDKISQDIINDTLEGDYLTLKNEYIQPVLVHFAVSYFLPYSNYLVKNDGVSKSSGGDNRDSVEKDEISYLINKEESKASSYKQRLIDYLLNNEDLFPEYSTNEGSDINPSTTNSTGGIFLG